MLDQKYFDEVTNAVDGFLSKCTALGMRVNQTEVDPRAARQYEIYYGKHLCFEVVVDYAGQLEINYQSYRDVYDVIKSLEAWKTILSGFYEIIESMTTRPFQEVIFVKKGQARRSFILFTNSNGKEMRLTDFKVRIPVFGERKQIIKHPPLSLEWGNSER